MEPLQTSTTDRPAPGDARGDGGDVAGPYRVERVETPQGPAWRLVGPGLSETKAYPWEEFRDKLAQMASLMNFAWHQCETDARSATR